MSRSASAPTAALPFIQSDDNGKFFFQPAAVKLLSSIKGPICPVVVAGPYRTGKSTLLNLLLDTNVKSGAGFAVGGTVQACTKGMWLWGEPVMIGGCTYVFIDSEGLGSTDQHATFDTQIFSLSILLSSLFILNTSGTINENALEQLELVVQMTDRIRIKEESKEKKSSTEMSEAQNLSSLAQFFPSFLWILRDFTLDLQNARGDTITPDEYLEDALKPVPIGANSKKGAAEKNRIRTAISTVFPNRHCVTMVRPVSEERDLKRVSTLGVAGLRNDFRTQIEHLKTLIPQLAHPKSVEGVQLNGRAFIAIAQKYVEAINTGSIPTIRTAFQSVQEIQGREAMDAALKQVQKALRETIESKGDNFILSDDAVEALLADIEAAAVALIREQALGSASDLHELTQTFITRDLAPIFETVRQRNSHRAEKSLASCVERLWDQSGIEPRLAEYTSYKKLNGDVSTFWANYLSETKNCGSKSQQLDIGRTFLDKKREIIFKMLFDKVDKSSRELSDVKKAQVDAQKRVAELESELQHTRHSHELELTKSQFAYQNLERDHTKLQRTLDDTEQRLRTSEDRVRVTEERAIKDRTQLESQLAEAKRTSSTQVASLQTQLAQTQSTLAETKAELKSLTKEHAQLEKSLAQARTDLVTATSGASQQTSTLQAEIQALRRELQTKESEVTSLKTKFETFQSSLKAVESERHRELQTYEESEKQLQKQLKLLEKKLTQANEAAEQATASHEQEKAEYEESIKSLRHELTQQKRRQADDHKAEIETLRQQLAQAQAAATAAASANSANSYSNPLGLPAPTSEPLVSRKSILPSSFNSSAAAASSSKGKRKSSPVSYASDEPLDHDMADVADDDDEEPAAASSSSRAAAASPTGEYTRRSGSLAPTTTGQDWRDPSTLNINQLKSWLTSEDIEFPQKAQPKAFYIDLLYERLGPDLEQAFPRGQSKKKGKK